jgi:two-component system chemotaxis response regulator CheV
MSASRDQQEGILLKSGTNEVEFIEFNIGKIPYGINVAKVQRVIARPSVKITRMDNASQAVLGVIYVHEMPVPLIDLRKALRMPEPPPEEAVDPDRQLILVTKFNKRTTAFLIDAVNKIHRTSWSEFEPIDQTLAETSTSSYVTGTIKIEGRVIVILDLEHLMLEFSPPETIDASPSEVDGQAGDLLEQRSQVRILYAEDSSIIRKMMLRTLQSGGYTQVKAFEHGKSAYDYIEGLKKQADSEGKSISDFIDCIITDIEMPQMDGLTLCKSVKENPQDSGIPAVIVYSSLVNEEMARKCQSVGADAQVSKPHGDEILQVLDQFCLGGEA